MTLQRIHGGGVFDDATTDERRARVYVRSGELGLSTRADVTLMDALATRPAPQRLHVVGPSGAGKTSLILRVVADLVRLHRAAEYEILILRVGDRPERLASPEEVMQMVLDTVAVEGHRFSNVGDGVLMAAAADERTQTPMQMEHQAGLAAGVISYNATLKEAYEALRFGQSSARVRHDLEDVLEVVRTAGYRPVLVLDGSEKFVSPGPDGTLDESSVENLYHHGVRVLGELPVDLVVAMHPRFEAVSRVTEVVERLAMSRIDVPELPAEADDPALSLILERRMERDGNAASLDSVIERSAVEELQVLYHERHCDLRSVLRLAHNAAEHALGRGSAVVMARDVRAVVAAASR